MSDEMAWDLAADLRTIRRVAKKLEEKWRDDKRSPTTRQSGDCATPEGDAQ